MKASTVNKYRFIRSLIAFAVVLVIGAVMTVFALKGAGQKIPENYVETEATIVEIKKELAPSVMPGDPITDASYTYTVFVDYTFDGVPYEHCEYGSYDSSMKKGDKVKLFVNPDSPTDFMIDPSGLGLFVIIGIGVTVVGIGGIVYTVIKKKKEE